MRFPLKCSVQMLLFYITSPGWLKKGALPICNKVSKNKVTKDPTRQDLKSSPYITKLAKVVPQWFWVSIEASDKMIPVISFSLYHFFQCFLCRFLRHSGPQQNLKFHSQNVKMPHPMWSKELRLLSIHFLKVTRSSTLWIVLGSDTKLNVYANVLWKVSLKHEQLLNQFILRWCDTLKPL